MTPFKILMVLVFILFVQVVGLISAEADSKVSITISATDSGRTTDGIGAISAGATTRLFKDYSTPVKNQIIDYLFGPNGAKLNHLKIEIPSDSNSTCGSQPAIARSRAELDNPTATYFNRGYDFEFAKKAKLKNPNLRLEALEWSAPGWVGEEILGSVYDQFYNQNNTDYICRFIKGAKTYHNLDINWVGTWNEMWRPDDPSEEPFRQQAIQWTINLRTSLNSQGLNSVKINAPDQVGSLDFAAYVNPNNPRYNPQLDSAVDILSAHGMRGLNPEQTAEAALTGKKICDSEEWEKLRSWGPVPWYRATIMGKAIIDNYIDHKVTLTDIWYPVDSFYNTNSSYNNGFITAEEPWSGHIYITPVLWIVAHMTQFIEVGTTDATSWKYVDTGCNKMHDSLGNTGSYVALRSPNPNANNKYEYSIVLQTFELTEPVDFTVTLAPNLENSRVYGWHSNSTQQLVHNGTYDIMPDENRSYTLTLQPGHMYTLTSWHNGQGRKVEPSINKSSKFPFPYTQNFNTVTTGDMAPYMADQEGAFEVIGESGVDNTKCLKQLDTYRTGPYWCPFRSTYTIIGDQLWEDYSVSCDAKIDVPNGYAALIQRYTSIHDSYNYWAWPKWYELAVHQNGSWELNRQESIVDETLELGLFGHHITTQLANGTAPAEFTVNGWNTLKMECIGNHIKAYIGTGLVANVNDTQIRHVEIAKDTQGKPIYQIAYPIRRGMAGLRTDFNVAYFDNLDIAAVSTVSNGARFPSANKDITAVTKVNHETMTEIGNNFDCYFEDYIGMQITVGAKAITLTELGKYFLTGNQRRAIISMIDPISNLPIATATIDMNQGLPNTDSLGFIYEAVDHPATLLPHKIYYIVSNEWTDAYMYRWLGGNNVISVLPRLETTSAVHINDAVYYDPHYGWVALGKGPGYTFGPLSFKYQ